LEIGSEVYHSGRVVNMARDSHSKSHNISPHPCFAAELLSEANHRVDNTGGRCIWQSVFPLCDELIGPKVRQNSVDVAAANTHP